MNAAMGTGGMNANQLFNMDVQQQAAKAAAQPAGGWQCACGEVNTGKFCHNCGKAQPANDNWNCDCGTANTGKFCQNCGKPRSDKWRCSCGAENNGKFCNECGKPR
jgi:membrane protease subunit (stomatin/prohibitin family)